MTPGRNPCATPRPLISPTNLGPLPVPKALTPHVADLPSLNSRHLPTPFFFRDPGALRSAGPQIEPVGPRISQIPHEAARIGSKIGNAGIGGKSSKKGFRISIVSRISPIGYCTHEVMLSITPKSCAKRIVPKSTRLVSTRLPDFCCFAPPCHGSPCPFSAIIAQGCPSPLATRVCPFQSHGSLCAALFRPASRIEDRELSESEEELKKGYTSSPAKRIVPQSPGLASIRSGI
jgi:hypothetical protein